MHTDAAQSCGKIETRVDHLHVDFLTIAGHKLYGPQGIGAMYARKGAMIEPLHHGAGHQDDRRSGVEPVALIVGLGAAAELARGYLAPRPGEAQGPPHLIALRDRLYEGLRSSLGDDVILLGHPTNRLPNTLCVGFKDRLSGDILAACPDVCASAGAACHSGKRERSATLAAMNVPEEIAFGAIRFSVGRPTTQAEIDEAIPKIVAAVSAC
jgi:cysteine desulfurase